MKPFEIILEREHGRPAYAISMPGTWAIRQGDNLLTGLCWDEMLGGVARCLINGCDWPKPLRWELQRFDHSSPAWSLRVEPVPSGSPRRLSSDFTLFDDGKFCGPLTTDEAIGFIALYTSSNRERSLFGGMKTYEQWIRQFPNRQQNIAGLLVDQRKAVAT